MACTLQDSNKVVVLQKYKKEDGTFATLVRCEGSATDAAGKHPHPVATSLNYTANQANVDALLAAADVALTAECA